jgi:hypothetical protein
MSIATVRPLAAAYALAAGEAIVLRVEKHGKLPADLKEDYDGWHQRHLALAAIRPQGPTAQFLDPFLDRAVLVAAHFCDLIIDAYVDVPVELDKVQRQRLADARLIRAAYPADLRDLTAIAYTKEWKDVRTLYLRLQNEPDLSAAMERLGLQHELALTIALHDAYGAALGISAETAGSPEARALADWNTAFAQLALTALHLGRRHPGLAELISAPYQEQLDKQAAAVSRARARRKGSAAAEAIPPAAPAPAR